MEFGWFASWSATCYSELPASWIV